MPDVDGVTLLKEWSASGQLQMPVIMMSGHGTIDTAVEATKYGASAFLEKPITLQKLLRAVEQALAKPAPRRARPRPGHHARYARGDAAARRQPGAAAATARPLPPAGWPTGPRAEQSFDLDRPLREARDAFEKSYFEFHLAKEGGSMTRVAEKTGPGAHPPVPQAQAAGRGPDTQQARRGLRAARTRRLYSRAHGLVAQLVEQRIENPRVGGSIPPQATIQINDLAQPHPLGFVASGLHVATM